MKKLYFLLMSLCLITGVNAQIINFPDANFKAKLVGANPSNIVAWNASGYVTIDTNGDGEISVSEAALIKLLNINGANVASMEGISGFVNLETLYCNNNSLLTGLDLRALTNLDALHCSSNALQTLNVNGLANLRGIECDNNALTSLDLTGLASLEYIDCVNNQITSLNFSNSPNMNTIRCSHNQLSSLVTINFPTLFEVDLSYNNLSSLSLNHFYRANSVDCSNNILTSITAISSAVNWIQYFYCSNNQLSTLNCDTFSDLLTLNCSGNQLASLNLSNVNGLSYLDCSSNQLATLNLPDYGLYTLLCNNNLLTNLTIGSIAGGINTFDCSNNLLTSLDLTGFTFLESFNCSNNQIQMLDFMNNIYIDDDLIADCRNNQLQILKVKNGKTELIDFGNNPNLHYICTDENQNEINYFQSKLTEYGLTNCNINTYCSFTPGGDYYEIKGNQKWDSNNNGCDASDPTFPNLRFTITNGTNSGSFISNDLGNYAIPVTLGTYTITPFLENPAYFAISPTNVIANFPSQASPLIRDFCVIPNGVHPDLEVVLLSTLPARPGFDANYKLVFKNKGNQIQSGSINLTFDDAVLDFVSANPTLTNQTINQLSWDFVNLKPFETREISLILNVNSPMETPAVNGGDVLNYSATITSVNIDETLNDNTFTLDQIVVNSFDPNDKTCLEGSTIAPSQVGKYVHYIIRFENTGTFPAENIVVKDMIDTNKFDINSLVPIKGSHSFVTNITSGNKVEFIFENINLPFDDANNDGYVAFKIKTKPTLTNGDTFSNSASIYFDYNFPIVTNTAITTIQALSAQDFEFGSYFAVYPNPVNNVLNIETKQTIEVRSINIYNTLGQLVLVVPNAQNVSNVDVSSLLAGNYFIKINSDKGTSNTKFIKK
ncbi:T9SS type A sorting domain-containing protein [Flavobacterium sp. SM15]|uniref:T9SS type A sorting domain-containing protein n=1 Tax=Flavobacterium sp. SM15 TaxID=2908005 RepID=UPI001EDBABC8|nr:T9SS type A sorting domain-containing protein [Flavobacterium sp. SM15]MCG2611426.1 T9SS type A sorting domain-containing protein [Flavobacterium sp. SM15]